MFPEETHQKIVKDVDAIEAELYGLYRRIERLRLRLQRDWRVLPSGGRWTDAAQEQSAHSSDADAARIASAEAQRDLLRAALVGLVGTDGHDALAEMESAMRAIPAPAQDKAATIDALHALMATVPAQVMDQPTSTDAVARTDGLVAGGPRA